MPMQKLPSTSTTCKKHAPKAAGPRLARRETRGATGAGVHPVKPQPTAPDPLDPLGLVYVLPAELVVILRRLGKHDTRAGAAERIDYAVRAMLPVWLHHVPLLLMHPSKRIRLLAVTLHAITLPLLAEEAPLYVLGVWLMIAHDPHKHVASVASTSSFRVLQRTRGTCFRFYVMYRLPLLSPSSMTLKFKKTKRRTLLSSPALWSALNPAPGPEALLFSTSNAPSGIGSCRNTCAALEEP
ncbi:hypothetical protein FIBSPDRAFT_968871 [Athelia psychrophila]|uniref:E3 ubiquitin-protein ligase listerin N-terminal domain-containing protein n=1 Tax=Athelia psychrophila TaxID=1759441 RepID=A0A167U4G4_9AGAM|nr:hypothetical protein FIBSPDRAFT_968871 [Fibularhizoctonia sp. CBS 109695]